MLTRDTISPANRDRTEEVTERRRDDDVETVRVELWREPTRTAGRNEFDRVAERLRSLEERGVVDAAAVESWDRYVDVSGGYPDDDVARATMDRVGRLQRWAWQRGESVPVREESQTACRGRLGPPVEVKRVPRAALVEFENGVVTNVTLADEQTGCLTERLNAIAERERAATEDRGWERDRPKTENRRRERDRPETEDPEAEARERLRF